MLWSIEAHERLLRRVHALFLLCAVPLASGCSPDQANQLNACLTKAVNLMGCTPAPTMSRGPAFNQRCGYSSASATAACWNSACPEDPSITGLMQAKYGACAAWKAISAAAPCAVTGPNPGGPGPQGTSTWTNTWSGSTTTSYTNSVPPPPPAANPYGQSAPNPYGQSVPNPYGQSIPNPYGATTAPNPYGNPVASTYPGEIAPPGPTSIPDPGLGDGSASVCCSLSTTSDSSIDDLGDLPTDSLPTDSGEPVDSSVPTLDTTDNTAAAVALHIDARLLVALTLTLLCGIASLVSVLA